MKQYVIDELRPDDHKKLKAYLEENLNSSDLDGIYWIPLEQKDLTDVQAGHIDCQPFYFAIELKPETLACELLIRTKSRVRCECIRYATSRQLRWLVRFVDGIFDKLKIIT
ncbi:MAG: hypothetical protein KJO26_08700 [Deltaproteobacteria bacterium]|nr:hypothetical protein [Deltaproteobacteria bacterium]MBT8374436.1 hypothetical protein [Deltaproteobacteria bacterium]NNK86353.1 hypothetical protein [Desulfobacterales bacterium]